MIIDCHGHYTTARKKLGDYRKLDYDDTGRYIDALDWPSAAERTKTFDPNHCNVYPRLAIWRATDWS